MNDYDLVILGGGAAGLSAAISYASHGGGQAILIEGGQLVGQKLAVTGNGRCNLSHTAAVGYLRTRAFFEDLGVLLDVDEAGRVYPMNRQAFVLRDILLQRAQRLGVEIITGTKAAGIHVGEDGWFSVETLPSRWTIQSKKLILCTGGKAGPQYGATGDGFSFARSLGHTVNPILPALVPMTYDEAERERLSSLRGVRARAAVKLLTEAEGSRSPKIVAEARGEVQFNVDGISGICVFDLSRTLARLKAQNREISFLIRVDFAPDRTEQEIAHMLDREGTASLEGILNTKVADVMRREAGSFDGGYAAEIKAFDIPVSGTKGWKEAQLTFGGVPLDEIDEETMESGKVAGLYLAGEILDYDGPSGGWNLDWAWNSGIRAGEHAATREV
jgi:predicted Rossmann fold flavoprotein